MGKVEKTKKKRWRKSINVSEHLEAAETNYQQTLASAKPQDDLFVLDTQGDEDLRKEDKPYPTRLAKQRATVLVKPKRPPRGKPQAPPKAKPPAVETFDLWDAPNPAKPAVHKPLEHIPAVIPPLPGQSYNPKSEDKTTILKKVFDEEIDKIKQQEHHKRVMEGYQVVEEDELEVESSEDEGVAEFRKNPPTSNKKLTRSESNKRKRQRDQSKQAEAAKLQRKYKHETQSIKKLVTTLEADTDEYLQQKHQAKQHKEQTRLQESSGLKAPKIRMGKFQYKLPDTEATYTQENMTLRKIPAKASGVEGYLDSLTRRRMIDLDEGKPHKKAKIITKERWSGEISREMQAARQAKKPSIPISSKC